MISNSMRKLILAGATSASLLTATSGYVVAADTVSTDGSSLNNSTIQLAQVTSVSELSDVLPSDWAYTALQRLVEEYGCLEGYPDRSFRGNRALTRYEFAAGLNACLDVIVQLIGDGDDLDTIRRLQEEFAAELATIRGRVDTLEADVAELEANQFSTNTKLKGELVGQLVIPFEAPDGSDEVTFEYRSRLNFDTSFTGEDRLRIRLQGADDMDAPNDFLIDGLADSSSSGGEDNVQIDDITYEFPLGDRIDVEIAANSRSAGQLNSSNIVPYDTNAVAEFGEDGFFESAFDQDGSFAIGTNISLTDNIILDLAYSTDNGQDATQGIFEEYEYLVQLNYLSDGLIDAAITFQDGEDPDTTVDFLIGGLLNLDFGAFELGGYYAFIEGKDGAGEQEEWQVGISISDFLAPGNELGIYGGDAFDNDNAPFNFDSDPIIIEAFYAIKLNKFLTITPAVIYADPDGVDGNDEDGVIGVVRTTFNF
ncbi:iron uptake porin [Leptothoe sp. PORK10 BA2]|uniref:iron uptake porin n=1 Tax=Leptothoe sp. PORK10 BA2 TaxID=3110254 RepID=UPI002B21D003|nr:iron uptake porin [Leptothoe sp. PORK10 BA2]MEA5463460.1 iron uptake porin [Leptothoe sp. PORK10 BA2]